jgi:hypothetical protein
MFGAFLSRNQVSKVRGCVDHGARAEDLAKQADEDSQPCQQRVVLEGRKQQEFQPVFGLTGQKRHRIGFAMIKQESWYVETKKKYENKS